eukprot:366067-Chlamydomonas_euryale.AAC.17
MAPTDNHPAACVDVLQICRMHACRQAGHLAYLHGACMQVPWRMQAVMTHAEDHGPCMLGPGPMHADATAPADDHGACRRPWPIAFTRPGTCRWCWCLNGALALQRNACMQSTCAYPAMQHTGHHLI